MKPAIDQILRTWMEGDEASFKTVFDHYYARLVAFAFRISPNRERSEELAANVMFKLWQNKSSLSQVTDFEAYLFRMIRNEVASAWRKKIVITEPLDNVQASELGITQHPEMLIEELQERYVRAVEKLPVRTREIFLMSREEGLTQQQIAERENIAISTVNNHITLALGRLRHELKDYSGSPLILFYIIDILK